jgi:hypothetical protein
MTTDSATLEQATAALAALSTGLRSRLSGSTDDEAGEVLRLVEELGRLADGLRIVSAADVAERSRKELGTEGMAYTLGCAHPVHLLEHLTLVSSSEAARRIRLGEAIRPRRSLLGEVLPAEFPALAVAIEAGTVGLDSADHIVTYLDKARRTVQPDDLARVETAVVGFAADHTARQVLKYLIHLLQVLDPDGTEPRDEEARAQRGFRMGIERRGMTHFSGWADPASAGLLRAMQSDGANPKARPRFLSDEERAAAKTTEIRDEDGTVHTTIIDPRTREQRQFDVLMGTLTAGLRNADTKSTSFRPLTTVMVTVTLDDFEKKTGAGWIDDIDQPIGAATVQQLACEGGITPIFLGSTGEVLHLGTPVRLFSRVQRKALAVRDGGCVWPGCPAPPSWCEAHHILEYEHGGKTDIDNGVLLCSAHHHMLHTSAFTMRMMGGKPELLAPPWLDPDQVWKPVGTTRALLRLAG